jgi:Flp pilus assembly protein TadG
MKLKFGSLSLLSRLAKDVRGTVLVQFTIYIIAIFGMMGLALDGGRFILVNNSLQELADAAALAGAAQLDGLQDAITRADAAAQFTANKNPPRWYDVGGSSTITTAYYSALNPDQTTTDPKKANYIQVTTAPSQTAPSFLTAVSVFTNSAVSNNTTRATAWAQGNNLANCLPTQSFMCNPLESSEANPGHAANFSSPNVSVGTMFHLVNGVGAPGNWGLLIPPPPLSQNPHDQTPFWAESGLGSSCTAGNTQGNVRTGNVAKDAQNGMNVRFDGPIASGDESLSAPIVIDGFTDNGGGFSCNRIDPAQGGTGTPATPCTGSNMPTGCPSGGFQQTDTNASAYDTACNSFPGSCPLPRDRVLTTVSTGNAAWSQVIIGKGANTADLQAYWNNHHSGAFPTIPANTAPRYYLYQLEASGTAAFTKASDTAEPHGPVCKKSTLGDASRRLINVAVVDCNYWNIRGTSQPLPPSYLLAQFFMTEPALSDGSIYAELVGTVQAVQAGTAAGNGPHPIVQLVR